MLPIKYLHFLGFLNTTSSSDESMDIVLPITVGIVTLIITFIIALIIVKWRRHARREARRRRTWKISAWCGSLIQKSVSIFRTNDDTAIEHQEQSDNEELNPVPSNDYPHLRNIDKIPNDVDKTVDDTELPIV